MGFFKKIFGGARANFCSSTGLSNRSLTRIDKRFKQEKAKRQDRKKKKKIKRVEYRPHQTIVHLTPQLISVIPRRNVQGHTGGEGTEQ